MTKFNVDDAFVPGNSLVGWGAVVAVCAGRTDQMSDVFDAELCAMSGAVAAAADLGTLRVTFETDSQLLAEALDMWRADPSMYAPVIEDVEVQLKMWFSKYEVAVCRHSASNVAHEQAKVAGCAMGDMPMQV